MEPGNPQPYAGEQIVGDQSFLRRLPVALVTKERLRFDAVVTAADIVGQAYNGLRRLAIQAGADLDKLGNFGRAFALGQAWTLVDQLHAIRELIKPNDGSEMGPFTQALLDGTKPATMLRNKMDHLADNLDNLSKRQGRKAPLFGSLSYVHTAHPQPTGGHVITIMSGSLHGQDSMPCVNPLGRKITLPVDLFTLSAFGYEIEFGRPLG